MKVIKSHITKIDIGRIIELRFKFNLLSKDTNFWGLFFFLNCYFKKKKHKVAELNLFKQLYTTSLIQSFVAIAIVITRPRFVCFYSIYKHSTSRDDLLAFL